MTAETGDLESKALLWAIDEDEEILELLKTGLYAAGHRFRGFGDPRQALMHLGREVPDLLIIGMELAPVGGLELLRFLRSSSSTVNLPVLVLADADADGEIVEMFAAGVDDVLRKPIIASDLHQVVACQLARARFRRDGRDRSKQGDCPTRELARSHDFLINVIDSSPNAIVAAGRDGAIVLFNTAAEAVLGWTNEEAIGKNVRELYPPLGAERIMRMLRSDGHGGVGRLHSAREVLVNTTGEHIPVDISAALVYDQGNELGTVGIFTDLRQRIQMEEKLQEAVESLDRTQRQAVVAELAGAAAHELNQPLTSLLGYAEFLRKGISSDPEKNERAIEVIYREARRIADVVRKIGRITNYKTKDYVGGSRIVDLDESSMPEEDVDESSEWTSTATPPKKRSAFTVRETKEYTIGRIGLDDDSDEPR